jgi:hypothetical protein
MARYYKITGLDEGVPIDPYVIDSVHEDIDCNLCELGDASRQAEEISQRQYTIEKIEGYIEDLKAFIEEHETNKDSKNLVDTSKAQMYAFYGALRLIKGE